MSMDDKVKTMSSTPGPRPKRKKPAAAPPRTAQQSLRALGEEIRSSRKRARTTGRVGWRLFRDDVRRGRVIDLAGLALLVAIAVSIASSPDYQVQQVTVVNAKAITGDQAARITGVLGTNIFMVDPAQVAARMRQSPFVKHATVATSLPGEVTIRVDERRPNVVWVLADNTPYLISDDGIVVGQAPTLQGFVAVYDLDTQPGSIQPGDTLERQDVIDVAQQLYMKLPGATGLRINRLVYQVAGGVTVVTDGGRQVRFGDGALLDSKIRVTAAVVKNMADAKAAWHILDVRAPDRVALMP